MTSTDRSGRRIGGHRREVDRERLGPSLLIASILILAIRTARWSPTHSDGLANVDWDKEIEHSVRIAKAIQAHLTTRYPELFPAKDVPWYQPTDAEVPK
jgi:hypothetical protein